MSDILILSLSKFFMFLAFWVGLPASLLGMLLVLGFENKSRLSLIVTLVGICGLACFGLGINLEGLITGEALSFSKWGPTSVHKATDPERYWLAISVWFIFSVVIITTGVCLMVKLIKNPNPSFKRDTLKRAP